MKKKIFFFFTKSSFHKIQYGESSIPDHLQWANVTIYSNEICPEHYSDFLPDVMLCAGGNVRIHTICSTNIKKDNF